MKRILLTVGSLALATGMLSAADTNKWETTAAAGLTLTRGNSETLLATLSVNSTRKRAIDEILLGVAGTYGEDTHEKDITLPSGKVRKVDETEKTAESLSAFGQYNYSFTERWYAGLRLDFLHDDIADLAYRVTVSPLVGYYAIKQTNTTLKFEAGPSGVIERQGDVNDEYIALRFGERFEHKFNPKAKVWQSLDYMPQIDLWHNYIIMAEIGAEAALTEKLGLRVVMQDIYDNEPADHHKNNDLKLIAGVAYKF